MKILDFRYARRSIQYDFGNNYDDDCQTNQIYSVFQKVIFMHVS